jgi:proteasome lid subunit RPN8/RPN11
MNKILAEISGNLLESMKQQSAEKYPEECCGVLIGTVRENGVRNIAYLFETQNQHTDNRARRFLIEPDDFRKADQFARENGAEIIGYYHSHPDHDAVPSEHDRELAWPWYIYIIISVLEGKPSSVLGWMLRDDRNGYDGVQIEIP